MPRPYRNRLIPYKALTYLLYSKLDFVIKRENQLVEVRTGPMARELRVSNSRLLEAIKWLQAVGLLESVNQPSRGCLTAQTKPILDYRESNEG